MVKLLFCFLNKPVSWAENSLTDFTLQYVFVCRIKADQNRTTTKKAHHNLRVGFRSKGVLVTDTQPSSCELCCNKHKQEMHGVGGGGGAARTDWSDLKESHYTLSSVTVGESVCSGYWKAPRVWCLWSYEAAAAPQYLIPDFIAIFSFS